MFKVETAIDVKITASLENKAAPSTKLVRAHTKVLGDHYISLSLSQRTRRHNDAKKTACV